MVKKTRFIAVISGKGGVGKTTVTINLASALISSGRRAVLLDGDLHTPNVGLHLGAPLLPKTSYEAIRGTDSLLDVAYRHSSGLSIIPSKLHMKDLSEGCFTKLAGRLPELEDTAEVILIDMPSGLNRDLKILLERCDCALIVTTPDFPSVTNALKALKMSSDLDVPVWGVVLNMVKGLSYEMCTDEIEAMLGQRVLASVPDDDPVRESIHLKSPVVHSHPSSASAEMFKKLALSLLA
jgi:septum site-determining protein MinD